MWSSEYLDSSRYARPGYENPPDPGVRTQTFYMQQPMIGDYVMPGRGLGKMHRWENLVGISEPHIPAHSYTTASKQWGGPADDKGSNPDRKDFWYFAYTGTSAPNHLHVGDIRLAFETVSWPGDW